MPEQIEQRVENDEQEYNVAEVENDEVHPIGGNRTTMSVVKHLELEENTYKSFDNQIY